MRALEEITRALVAGYAPDRIILFGSQARGTATAESDFDLMVIKETMERRIDRRVAVRKLISERVAAVDIDVLTPSELLYLYSRGSPFICEIVETGKVIYVRELSAGWFDEAMQELETAEYLLQGQKHKVACLHAQQATEKAFKTFILDRGEKLQRTHDISALQNRAKQLGAPSSLSVDDAVFLSSVYEGRYPSEEGLLPHGSPSADDAARAVRAARVAVMEIKDALLATSKQA